LKLLKEKRKAGTLDLGEAEDLLDQLLGVLENAEAPEECAVCFETIDEESAIVLRQCKHVFCRTCLDQVTNAACPLCRASFLPEHMISKADVETIVEEKKKKKLPNIKRSEVGTSPKLQALFSLIDKMKHDEKGVIFSQWTSLLDIVQRELQERGHSFTRIDGKMSAEARTRAMEAFHTERCDSMRYPRFILCSLHACGVGVNLDRGNVAYLLDPWWNAAAELQCMNRVHRLTSKRPVRIYRLVMNNTLDQRMLGIQEAKDMLGKGILQRLSREEKRKARLTQLRDLFQLPENLEQDWEEW
jgi:SWI/SNF-related matrix-associated actin-dependent regulator of chromatin subfamily A3